MATALCTKIFTLQTCKYKLKPVLNYILHSNLHLQIYNHMYLHHNTNNRKQYTNFNVPQNKHTDVIMLSVHNHNSKQTFRVTRM